MFTGIVELIGTVFSMETMDKSETGGHGVSLVVSGCEQILEDVILGDSIAVNGVCLTVTEIIQGKSVKFGLSPETMRKTCFNQVSVGSKVNLERAMKAGQRFSGHFVQGHVDTTVEIVNVQPDPPNSVIYTFKVPEPQTESDNIDFINYIIPKGYVCLDGTSLTVISVDRPSRTFTVMLIKYTQEHVIMPLKKPGDLVNIEVDQVGKYVENILVSMFQGEQITSLIENVVTRVLQK